VSGEWSTISSHLSLSKVSSSGPQVTSVGPDCPGARFYYYSAILHDWPDRECVQILKIVADAMRTKYSKLLINGIILRETGATYFEACKDFGMMAAMSAKERTLPQVIALGAEAGLRFVRQHTGQHADNEIVEFEKR